MRRKNEEEPVGAKDGLEDEGQEPGPGFDVDPYLAPEVEEVEVSEPGTWFEDGDLYVEEEEAGERVEEFRGPDEPAEAEVRDAPREAPKPEGPETGQSTKPTKPTKSGRPAEPPAKPTRPTKPARPPAKPKEPREPIGPRIKATWAALLGRAKSIELPGAPDPGRRRIGVVAAIALACLLVGVGAFLIGKGTGASLDQARQEGETAGREAGTIEGSAEGYSAGFRKGRQKAFRDAYVPAYRLGYKRAFEQAGLSIPTDKEFEVPLP